MFADRVTEIPSESVKQVKYESAVTFHVLVASSVRLTTSPMGCIDRAGRVEPFVNLAVMALITALISMSPDRI